QTTMQGIPTIRAFSAQRPICSGSRCSPCAVLQSNHAARSVTEQQMKSRLESSSQASSSKPTEAGAVPKHVACIMDGNFRWATRIRGIGDWRQGHMEGINALRRVIKYCQEDGVKALTVYGFSWENWGRGPEEVRFLLGLLEG
ncbi:hypothetical protein Agub_g9556, partial [Astrephomene gubernaculifera]